MAFSPSAYSSRQSKTKLIAMCPLVKIQLIVT